MTFNVCCTLCKHIVSIMSLLLLILFVTSAVPVDRPENLVSYSSDDDFGNDNNENPKREVEEEDDKLSSAFEENEFLKDALDILDDAFGGREDYSDTRNTREVSRKKEQRRKEPDELSPEGSENVSRGVDSDLTSATTSGVAEGGDNVTDHVRRRKKQKGPLNPWAFEWEIGPDPNVCFNRLSIAKSAIEDYAEEATLELRQNAERMTVVKTNWMNNHATFKRFSEGVFSTEKENLTLADDLAVQLELAPVVLPPETIPDCHFIQMYKHQWIKLVSSCPQRWTNDTIENLCLPQYDIMEDNTIDLLNLPVQDGNGVVYRNIYCAECNKADDVHAWDVVVVCDGTSSLFFIDGSVMMTIMPKLAAAPHCKKSLWPRLPEKVQTCRLSKRSAKYPRRSTNKEEYVTYPVSFSVLMNFGFDGKTHILFSTSHDMKDRDRSQCTHPNQVIDSNNECRTIVCPEGYKLVDDDCVIDSLPGTPQSNEDLIPDVQALTHLPDVAQITLIVNATYRKLLALMSPGFTSIMVSGIATLFNISSERIQNFTIKPIDSDHQGPQVAVKTIQQQILEPGEIQLGPKSETDMFPSEEGHPQARVSGTKAPENQSNKSDVVDISTTVTSQGAERLGTLSANNRLMEIKSGKSFKKDDKFNRQKVDEVNNHNEKISQHHHTKDHPSTSSPRPFDILSEKTISLEFRFLILPPRSSMLNELPVSSIKDKMDQLFKQKKFSLSLNGTEVTVVDMRKDNNENQISQFCTKGRMQFYFADQLDIIDAVDAEGNSVTHVMVNSTNSIYGPGKFDLTVWVSGNVGSDTNVTEMMGYAFVCVMPRISHQGCARFELSDSEYVLFDNKSVEWDFHLYNMTQYEYIDEILGLIEICVPEYLLHPETHEIEEVDCSKGFEKFIMAEAYMTSVLGRISIVALSIVLITYLLFPRLRNLPGVNTMNLTLSLLVAESIFITGESANEPAWLCSMVAVLLHYFFLASFFWMNVMSYDVFRTFAHKTCVLPHIREKSKYLCKYVLYCWGSPAIIVGFCAIIDFTKVIPGVVIGYGGSSAEIFLDEDNSSETDDQNRTRSEVNIHPSLGCWIQNPIASLTAFGAPIVVILLVNIYLFAKTIFCIQKTSKFTNDHTRRSSHRRTGRNDVMLYVRMSTVMGFTWVFGHASSVVSAFTSPPTKIACYTEYILGLLFIISNCSQGLFIFFAFVTKRRVYYLYKGLWFTIKQFFSKGRRRHTSASTTSTSSSSSTSTSISTIS